MQAQRARLQNHHLSIAEYSERFTMVDFDRS